MVLSTLFDRAPSAVIAFATPTLAQIAPSG